jgi:type I restriction enzyme S subunit
MPNSRSWTTKFENYRGDELASKVRKKLKFLTTNPRQTVDPKDLKRGEVFLYSIPSLDEISDGVQVDAANIGSAKLRLRGNEVLISKINPRITRVHVAEPHSVPTLASTEFIALTCGSELDPRYLNYVLQSELSRQEFAGAALSVTRSQQRVRPEVVLSMLIDAPRLSTQRKIASLLDRNISRLDQLIRRKQRMDALLDESLRVRIERALCIVGGAQVAVRRLLVSPPKYGASEAGEIGTPGPRYIRITDIDATGRLRGGDVRTLSPELAAPYRLSDWDILIARSGATVGKSFAYRASMGECCFAGYLIRFRVDPSKLHPGLFEMWTQTSHYWNQVRSSALLATIENVSAQKYRELRCPVPPIDEQSAILAQLTTSRGVSREVRSRLSSQIQLLYERRRSLITEAVAGQLDVSVGPR